MRGCIRGYTNGYALAEIYASPRKLLVKSAT